MNAASQQTTNLAQANGKSPSFQIKQLMKTIQLKDYSSHPALFRIAAFIENADVPNFLESTPIVTEAAFARLRSEAARSKTGESKNGQALNTSGSDIFKQRAARTAPQTMAGYRHRPD